MISHILYRLFNRKFKDYEKKLIKISKPQKKNSDVLNDRVKKDS